MYSIALFEAMIDDAVRMDAYAAALRTVVREDALVVDIGAGTGVMSILACRFGARHVFAIELDDAIHVARENAAANGVDDRITFIQDLSTNVTLPQPADVIVSDLRGVLPLFGQHIPSIIHARQHQLSAQGTLLPQLDNLWVAVCEEPQRENDRLKPWDRGAYNIQLPSGSRYISNTIRKARIQPGQLLSEPSCWATIDYRHVDSPNCTGKVQLKATRPGQASGLAVWFDTRLLDDIQFSTAPGQPETIYGRMFFPFSKTIGVAAGDHFGIEMQATLSANDYIWQWNTSYEPGNHSDSVAVEFHQSSFFAKPLSATGLRKRADSFSPTLSENGRIYRYILNEMEQRIPLGEVAKRLAEQFPNRFESWQSALTHVGEISERYSQ